jgi:hypothetical protein
VYCGGAAAGGVGVVATIRAGKKGKRSKSKRSISLSLTYETE